MVEFRWIRFSLFLMLAFMLPEATGKYSLLGNNVTLPCAKGIDGQNRCNSTTWFFGGSKNKVKLIEHGQIHEEATSKSDRLSVTENCSLVIQNVTAEDAGLYKCSLFQSGQQRQQKIILSVVNLTEHENNDEVTLSCSVLADRWCEHTVKWLYEGKNVDEDNKDMNISQSECSATVTLLTSSLKSKYRELFQCEVTDDNMKGMERFTFGTESSDQNPDLWWLIIIVAVVLVALLITAVIVIRWKRTKGNKTLMNEYVADPIDGVSYSSISLPEMSNSKAEVLFKDGDENDYEAVTYTTVKASSSSAGASADPSNLYTTINGPMK